MSDVTLFAVKLLGSFLVFLYAAIEIALEHRSPGADGASRISRIGVRLVVLAGFGFFVTTVVDGVTQRKDEREKASADSLFRARTEDITRRQQGALAEIISVRSESDSLRTLQLQALSRMDSVSAAGERLSDLQRQTVRDLASELALSRLISDSMQASVALSRGIVDSLRLAERRAAERSLQTLESVVRRSNPLTSMSAGLHIQFDRKDSLSAQLLDAIARRALAEHRLIPTFPPDTQLVAGREKFEQVLPTAVSLYFWRGTECESSFDFNDVFVSADRRLNYDSVEVEFVRDSSDGTVQTLHLTWGESPFEFRTLRNITVDDLGGACVLVQLGPVHMTWPELSTRWWEKATVWLSGIGLPQGRFAGIEARFGTTGRGTHYIKLRENPPSTTPTQSEAVERARPH